MDLAFKKTHFPFLGRGRFSIIIGKCAESAESDFVGNLIIVLEKYILS